MISIFPSIQFSEGIVLISVFSPKGGVGTSSIATLFSVAFSKINETLLIDACNGDIHGICSLPEAARYSFQDWLESKSPTENNLQAIAVDLDKNLSIVVSRRCIEQQIQTNQQHVSKAEKEQTPETVVEMITRLSGHQIIDIGVDVSELNTKFIQASDLVVIVVKQCYLSLMNAMSHPYLSEVDVCVIVKESGRSISTSEICSSLKVNCVIEIEAQKDYARTIDAGMLIHRTPKRMIEPINAYLRELLTSEQPIHRIPTLRRDLFEESRERNRRSFWNSDEDLDEELVLYSPFIKQAKKRLDEAL